MQLREKDDIKHNVSDMLECGSCDRDVIHNEGKTPYHGGVGGWGGGGGAWGTLKSLSWMCCSVCPSCLFFVVPIPFILHPHFTLPGNSGL